MCTTRSDIETVAERNCTELYPSPRTATMVCPGPRLPDVVSGGAPGRVGRVVRMSGGRRTTPVVTCPELAKALLCCGDEAFDSDAGLQ